ncbi:MAG: hypothetical protein Q7S53_05725 [bacterium]|nr:hypothetical protein [bacterium]
MTRLIGVVILIVGLVLFYMAVTNPTPADESLVVSVEAILAVAFVGWGTYTGFRSLLHRISVYAGLSKDN